MRRSIGETRRSRWKGWIILMYFLSSPFSFSPVSFSPYAEVKSLDAFLKFDLSHLIQIPNSLKNV